ncbi:hypothetical protein ScPMuIL_013781 [Solemya velum]
MATRQGFSEKSKMATITITPDEALVDEKVVINVTGLEKHQLVTLHASLTHDKKTFASCASYVADDTGTVSSERDTSVQGTYTGVEPMGLFWSMVPTRGQRRGTRLSQKNISVPLEVKISVYGGHWTLDHLSEQQNMATMAETRCLRWYKNKSVTAHPVKVGRIRGTLFLPPGGRSLPGVIDLFGAIGGLVEYRAALLASRGFVTLALAFMGYDDLPDVPPSDLGYFQEAVDWLSCQPRVQSGGVGVIGVSKGGEIGLTMAAYIPKVKAVVNINGPTFYMLPSVRHADDKRYEDVDVDLTLVQYVEDCVVLRGTHYTFIETHFFVLKIWNGDAKVLSVIGGDDQCLDTVIHQRLLDKMPSNKKSNMEILKYPGAGHLIEPPYMPLCRSSYNNTMMSIFMWGGEPKSHAIAQEDSWKRIQEFFHKHLQTGNEQTVVIQSKL